MTTMIHNKYKVDDEGYSFTAPYNAAEGFSDRDCLECGHEVQGEGVFATGVKIIYTENYEYQPLKMELLKNIWMECSNCGWDQYS